MTTRRLRDVLWASTIVLVLLVPLGWRLGELRSEYAIRPIPSGEREAPRAPVEPLRATATRESRNTIHFASIIIRRRCPTDRIKRVARNRRRLLQNRPSLTSHCLESWADRHGPQSSTAYPVAMAVCSCERATRWVGSE